MIVSKMDYHMVPDGFHDSLEKLYQGMFTQLFELSMKVWNNREIDLWNCSVYRSGIKGGGKRLRIVNHSSGYFAVIEMIKSEYCHLPQYRDAWNFNVYAAQSGDSEKRVKIDWLKFLDDWGLDLCDLYWEAKKLSNDKSWYAPTHTIDLKHPLLRLLKNDVGNMKRGRSEIRPSIS